MTNLRLKYQTIEFGDIDIHVCTLRDRQEFHDPDSEAENLGICSAAWPIFGVVWPSSIVLAHYISDYDTDSKRILEIGCGTALSSLLLNKQNADITATDRHPEAGNFLQRNTELNQDKAISYERADWEKEETELGKFDLIIGSDLLYEDEHIKLLSNFINHHAKSDCEVILVDPGRGRKNKLKNEMISLGFSASHFKPKHTSFMEEPFKGYILKYVR